ncbi:MAG: hypothetical protein RLZZ15_4191 [Verrucomicrobiota bacterium]|jgi:uncharacterized RDD family membrane protein YckC
MQWYYDVNGQRQGPIAQAELESLVAQGVIKPETRVWCTGMKDWAPYAQAAAGQGAAPAENDSAVCAVSGKIYPKSQMVHYEGRWISAEHRDEFFQRVREGAPMVGAATVPGPFGYGSFLQRFCASFLDGLIVGLANFLVGLVVGATMGASGMLKSSAGPILLQVIVQTLGLALGISYHIYFIRKHDATPGKMALGLKLLRSDGSKLSVGRIIGRYFSHFLSAIILGIGYIMAAFDPERRALHDRVCDTRVIKTK